ncbi:acyltransferase [Alkalibacter saccharofermentans]|uniref:Surface polysaccharide O-acyltransferase, integral membrane enzyme n=1 Tax=Alkalibacter saccharofermentans DSM 14828 TaxID=1120975 RepID=A0A1M4ZSC0_9FIRM|nr:acyltransferase family protein [Alkalibacter saccharofermentans]SHF20949.1 Surface polysaccharide O-acyltransferase, integral membrane enzyme [Alkalibacter saccharofermentans DSM 14828]
MREKDYSLEILRIMSMFMVIAIHVANYYCRNLSTVESFSYLGATFFNALSRTSVPIFFMISGALTLGKRYDHEKNKNKVWGFVFTLVFWTSIYYLWNTNYLGKDMELIPTIIESIFKPVKPHLWFMYPFIGLLIALPFASVLVKNMDKTLENKFVKLWMFFSGAVLVFRMGFDLLGISTAINYNVPIVQGTYYLGYFIVGYILYRRIKNNGIRQFNYFICFSAYFLSILVMWLGTFYLSVLKQSYYDWIYTYRSIFTMFATLSLFALVVAMYKPQRLKAKKIIDNVSKASFGIYLIHMIPLEIIQANFDMISVNGFLGVPVFTGIVFIASYLMVSVIKRVPVLNKFT